LIWLSAPTKELGLCFFGVKNPEKLLLWMTYSTFEGCADAALLSMISQLYTAIFGVAPAEKVFRRLREADDLSVLLATTETGQAAGYKIGYRQREDTYYSWIGGVLPEHRGQGIAGVLMQMQHDWAAMRGYRFVQTKTMNRWRNMLILNIQHGFDIIGTQVNEAGEVEIILEKALDFKAPNSVSREEF
jgi:GNAT superfamily N-acetyltransferase